MKQELDGSFVVYLISNNCLFFLKAESCLFGFFSFSHHGICNEPALYFLILATAQLVFKTTEIYIVNYFK